MNLRVNFSELLEKPFLKLVILIFKYGFRIGIQMVGFQEIKANALSRMYEKSALATQSHSINIGLTNIFSGPYREIL